LGWAVARLRLVPAWEVSVFRWWNGLPDVAAAALWAPMQFGSLVGPVVVAAGAVIVTMRARPAVDVLVAGLLGWLVARVIKDVVDRGRPEAYLVDVAVRGASVDGFGFVSGHTAVAFAVATVLAPDLSPRWRVVAFVLAACVGAARMVIGAHFPADVVGGAGVGLLCGAAARLVIDRVASAVRPAS